MKFVAYAGYPLPENCPMKAFTPLFRLFPCEKKCDILKDGKFERKDES